MLKLYFCFTIASLLVLLGLTIASITMEHLDPSVSGKDDLTVSLILLIGIVFCIYYIGRGVLQDNRQELLKFLLSVLLLMIRSIVNFCVLTPKGQKELLARFVCIMTLGVVHIVCSSLLIRSPNSMAFRVGGALESLQDQYFLLNLCFSLVTFDLQAQLSLCILLTTSDPTITTQNSIILGVGVFWACLTAAVGAIGVLRESKALVWVFMVQNLPQAAFFLYLIYTVVVGWNTDTSPIQEAAAVTGATISLVIKLVLFWSLVKLIKSFGQGLRERMSAPG